MRSVVSAILAWGFTAPCVDPGLCKFFVLGCTNHYFRQRSCELGIERRAQQLKPGMQ